VVKMRICIENGVSHSSISLSTSDVLKKPSTKCPNKNKNLTNRRRILKREKGKYHERGKGKGFPFGRRKSLPEGTSPGGPFNELFDFQ
jgi:hypothetical protein